MSPKEFLAWLEGYNEASGGEPPNSEGWARVLEEAQKMANPPGPAVDLKDVDPKKLGDLGKPMDIHVHRFTPGEGSLLGKLDMRGYVKASDAIRAKDEAAQSFSVDQYGKLVKRLADNSEEMRRLARDLAFDEMKLWGGAKPLDPKKLEATRLEQLRKRAAKS